MKRMLGMWIVLLALGHAGEAKAQEVVTFQSNRGWIGITFNFTMARVGDEERTVVVIEDVVPGSPAEAAGIQVGDTLTHLDGQPISQRVFSSLGTLEVGDLVRMTIRRDRGPVEILVEAGSQRPRGWVIAPHSGEMVVHLDSIRGAILENLDSLKLSIARVGPDSTGRLSISILKAPPAQRERGESQDFFFQFSPPDSANPWADFLVQRHMPVPFGALVTGTEEADSLKKELQRIRKALTEVRRAELRRLRELQAGVQRPAEELATGDERILELRAREEALIREQTRATRTLQRLSEELMVRQMARLQEEQAEAIARIRESRVRSEEGGAARGQAEWRTVDPAVLEEYEIRRPTSHVIVGQSFVAGAQLTPLNPSLAEYFQAEEGVLVTEVLEGTPADEAGMKAGDVIVRVGTESVASLEDLRFAVGYLERPLRFQVIRKGSPLEVVIRK